MPSWIHLPMHFPKNALMVLGMVLLTEVLRAQDRPVTVAERSGYKATSRFTDVTTFMDSLLRTSDRIRQETLCTSAEGRPVPLYILGDPVPVSPIDRKRDPRVVVYIQANIHAGEVEGKEACLILAHEILVGTRRHDLKRMVILLAPIFNADGNEKISPDNRRSQNGPSEGVGVRYNGQQLDLNRDGIKLESPELQGLVRNVLLRWDPAVVVDCHTTNGSFHEEPVTYSEALNPNIDPRLTASIRDTLLPEAAKILKEKYGVLSIPYGNFVDPAHPEKGWESFEAEGRFVTNYAGLRNRISILDENYTYADFRTRVQGCLNLLHSLLDVIASHPERILRWIEAADSRTVAMGADPGPGDSLGISFALETLDRPIMVQSWDLEVIPRPGNAWPQIKRTDRKRTYTIPHLGKYRATRSVVLPWGYLIPIFGSEVETKLEEHGIKFEKLSGPVVYDVEAFIVREIRTSERPFQGHWMTAIKGDRSTETREFGPGTLFVPMAQPLARLAAALLEPECEDGLVAWNFLDRYLVPQWSLEPQTVPIFKILKPPKVIKGKD